MKKIDKDIREPLLSEGGAEPASKKENIQEKPDVLTRQ